MTVNPAGAPRAAAPAGWYDDGSGRLRWWDGQQWTAQFATPGARTGAHRWWVWSPAYTMGLFAFAPALHAAIKLRRRNLWVWATGLIAADLVVWGLVGGTPANPDGSNTPIQDVGVVLALVLAVAGTVHAFRVRDEVFGTSSAGAPAGLDPAVAHSLAARRRRADSVALCVKDPGLARDLRIGRPDLERQYDDGGLVDVNHVPEAFLVSHLGLSPDQARTVVAARDHIGGFQSATELSGLAEVPPKALDAIRDRIVTL